MFVTNILKVYRGIEDDKAVAAPPLPNFYH